MSKPYVFLTGVLFFFFSFYSAHASRNVYHAFITGAKSVNSEENPLSYGEELANGAGRIYEMRTVLLRKAWKRIMGIIEKETTY